MIWNKSNHSCACRLGPAPHETKSIYTKIYAPTADAHKSPPHRSSLHIPKQYRIKFEADPKQRSRPKTAKFGSVAARMTMPDSSDCLVREFPPWPLATCCPARRYPLWHQWHCSAASAAWSGPARPGPALPDPLDRLRRWTRARNRPAGSGPAGSAAAADADSADDEDNGQG